MTSQLHGIHRRDGAKEASAPASSVPMEAVSPAYALALAEGETPSIRLHIPTSDHRLASHAACEE